MLETRTRGLRRMLAAAKDAGFTYAVMVTKHHDGFTFWPSKPMGISARNTALVDAIS